MAIWFNSYIIIILNNGVVNINIKKMYCYATKMFCIITTVYCYQIIGGKEEFMWDLATEFNLLSNVYRHKTCRISKNCTSFCMYIAS